MSRLKQEINELRSANRDRIEELRADVHAAKSEIGRVLADFRAEFKEAAGADQEARSARLAELRAEVRSLSDDVALKLEAFRESLAAEAEKGRVERPQRLPVKPANL